MPTDFLISFMQNCANLFFLAGLIKSHMFLRPCLLSLVLPMLHIRFYTVLVQLRQPRIIDVLNLFPERWNSEGFPAFFASGASRLLKLKLFSLDLLFYIRLCKFFEGMISFINVYHKLLL